MMQKRAFIISIVMLLIFTSTGLAYLHKPIEAVSLLDMEIQCRGTVYKEPGESFKVEINFKNKGTTKGTWKIAVTFEGDDWIWKGEEKMVSIEPGQKESVTWEGTIPEEAATDSIARLVVYYNDDFKALNWWIHVVGEPELCIAYCKVS